MFSHNLANVRVVDSFLKKFITNFPAKLMEIERDCEDELNLVEEISAKGQVVGFSFFLIEKICCRLFQFYIMPLFLDVFLISIFW